MLLVLEIVNVIQVRVRIMNPNIYFDKIKNPDGGKWKIVCLNFVFDTRLLVQQYSYPCHVLLNC